MINGAHVLLYSSDADADRKFICDVLGFTSIDAGGGWLISALPPAEVAVHPTDGPPQHELFLMCDDLEATLAELAAKGAMTARGQDERWGRSASVRLPSGAGPVGRERGGHDLRPPLS